MPDSNDGPDRGPDSGPDDSKDGTDDEVVDAELVDAGAGPIPGGMDALGGLGELDMGSLLGTAMEMQQQLLNAQAEAASTEVEGQAGGGVVRITMTAGFEFRGVQIAPEAVDPDDVEMLQDLVLAALHDAVSRANEIAQDANPLGNLDGLLGGLGGGAEGGGFDLGALFGGAADADGEDDGEDDEDGELDDGGGDDGGTSTPRRS